LKSGIVKWIKKHKGQFPKNDDYCDISATCSFTAAENIKLGKWVFMGPKCFIDAKGGVDFRDGVILSSRVVVLSSTHDYNSDISMPYGGSDIARPVVFNRGVWVGYGATILPGVELGEGVIVGAGAIVTKNVDAGLIVGGNPAKVIGNRKGDTWRMLLDKERYRIRDKVLG